MDLTPIKISRHLSMKNDFYKCLARWFKTRAKER